MLRKVVKISRTVLEGATLARVLNPVNRGKWIVQRMQDMGPTYVKLGQFLSSRADIIGPDTIVALKELQDSSNPLPWSSVSNLIDMDQFTFIDQVPMASASIGQVHRGKLADGTDICIKFRRPGIVKAITGDIYLLETILNFLAMLPKQTNNSNQKMSDTQRIVADLKAMILNETDFVREVQNMKLMTEMYPDIRFPFPFIDMCSEDVIVMKYVPSVKLSSFNSTTTTNNSISFRSKLAYDLMDTFIQQFLQHGMIHGDPHEGNVALSSADADADADASSNANANTSASNVFVMYDLGHIVQLDAPSRSLMKILVFEIMTENVDGVILAMENMPKIIQIRDKKQVREFVKKYIEYVKTIDVQVLSSLDSRDVNLPVQFSSTVFEIVRVFGIIEGICLSLDPTFQYEKVFYKYIDTLLLDRDFLEYKAGTDLAKMWKWIT